MVPFIDHHWYACDVESFCARLPIASSICYRHKEGRRDEAVQQPASFPARMMICSLAVGFSLVTFGDSVCSDLWPSSTAPTTLRTVGGVLGCIAMGVANSLFARAFPLHP